MSTITELPQFATQAFLSLKCIIYILIIVFFVLIVSFVIYIEGDFYVTHRAFDVVIFVEKSCISFSTRTKVANVSKIKA